MDGTNGSNQSIGTNMIQTAPFADSAAVAAAAAAVAAQRTQPSSSSSPAPGGDGILPMPPPNTRSSALPAPPSTPSSPPPILHSRGLSPDELLSATVGDDGGPNDSSSTLGTANLSAVQQPVLSLAGVTFGGGSHRVVQPRQLPLGPNGSPLGSSPESAGAGQGGGWRQMTRQQHDHQFGPRRGTMNTNPSAPPSKRRRTMMEAFGDMTLSRRRGMAGLDLATSSDGTDGGSSASRSGLEDGETMVSSTRSLGDFAFNAGFNSTTTNRPSRPSPIAGLTGVGSMQHIGFSSVASHSSPGHGQMRRSVGTSSSSGNGATPSEETIEDDSDDPLDVSPYNNNIAVPMALPPKPDSNVIRITSLDMESASETASEMDEGVLDGFPPLAVASSTTDRPRNPVDAKIEELIRRDRMRAMIQAKLEAEGKKPANGSSQERKTRDDFDYQGTFTTAGSTTWRKPDAVMGNMPSAAAQVELNASITPISIPVAIPPHHPASTAGTMLPSAAASAAAMAASATMPPPAPVSTTNNSNPNEGNAKVAPGMMRGRSTERRSSRGSRSRSLPRQYMKMAPQPSQSRDVSMASASSAATSGGGESDMDL